MKLIARTTVKHGTDGETAAPGETFEIDEKKYPESAKQLVESGAAEPAAKPDPKAKDKE